MCQSRVFFLPKKYWYMYSSYSGWPFFRRLAFLNYVILLIFLSQQLALETQNKKKKLKFVYLLVVSITRRCHPLWNIDDKYTSSRRNMIQLITKHSYGTDYPFLRSQLFILNTCDLIFRKPECQRRCRCFVREFNHLFGVIIVCCIKTIICIIGDRVCQHLGLCRYRR